jgi:spore coat protein U-like protein
VIVLGASAAALSSPASAGTKSDNLGVSATVAANCTISTTALDFGSIDTLSASPVTGTGGISVTCTSGTGWTAAADAGTGTGASYAGRQMTSGAGDVLGYNLFTTGAYAVVWGDGTSSSATVGDTGSGSAQSVTIYGRIPAGQLTVPAGSYADTVAVTVTY